MWERLTAAFHRNRQRRNSKFVQYLCAFGEMEFMPLEKQSDDAGIDDEAIEAQQPHVVAVGRGRTKQESEHHVASQHACPASNLV